MDCWRSWVDCAHHYSAYFWPIPETVETGHKSGGEGSESGESRLEKLYGMVQEARCANGSLFSDEMCALLQKEIVLALHASRALGSEERFRAKCFGYAERVCRPNHCGSMRDGY